MIEFYNANGGMIASTNKANGVPLKGDFISIRGETWMVTMVTWALDQIDDHSLRCLRANVTIEKQ